MRVTSLAVALCLSVVGIVAAQDAAAVARRQTNIAAQGLGPALQNLAQERGFQVVYLSDSVDSLQTAGAVGEFTDTEAIGGLKVPGTMKPGVPGQASDKGTAKSLTEERWKQRWDFFRYSSEAPRS